MTAPTPELAASLGYFTPKRLATGEIAGVRSFVFTSAIVVGIDHWGYRTRFCYERWMEAVAALANWDGHGDPPGQWIKEKGEVERSNPHAVEPIE